MKPNIIDNLMPFAIIIALLAALMALSGCASVPAAAAADKPIQEPMNAHDARAAQAQALQQIGVAAKDAETQRMAIMAVMMLGQGAQAAPAPAPVVVGNRSIGDAIFGFLDRTLERAINVAPAYLAYKGQVRSAETTERVSAINRDVSLNQSNNFLQLGVAGITGTQNVGVAGVNALATVASRPTTPTTNISGNTGPVLVGGGNLNNGSLNPVNPAPVVCTVGTATVAGNCSR